MAPSSAARKPVGDILAERGPIPEDVIAIWLRDPKAAGTDERLVDLQTPIPETAEFELVRKSDSRGLEVIRHSTAHVLADAVQRLFPGTKVTFGPATENGFYYDFDRPQGAFSEDELQVIEDTMRQIIAKKLPFRREPITREEALDLFKRKGETYKVEWIESRPPDLELSVYRHGQGEDEWVDYCKGPHVPNTEYLAAVKLTAVSGTYWRGDERNPQLQRIYGTAFPSQAELAEYLKLATTASWARSSSCLRSTRPPRRAPSSCLAARRFIIV